MKLDRETVRKILASAGLTHIGLALLLLFTLPAFADDCTRDWRRAED